ncbi:MAG: response regulator [Rhizobacter sp.]|nr:response regulator [Rhizobacter sp.]
MPQTLTRAEPSWRERHDAPTFFACGRRPQVLVVEDDPVQALLLNLMLEHLGVDSQLVNDGAAAVDAVKAGRFALVLMDYLMPVLNGVEATRLIRRFERDSGRAATPIVAVTASAMGSECEAYRAAGMNDVILKPFSAQALADVLARHGLLRHGLAQAPTPLVHGAVA